MLSNLKFISALIASIIATVATFSLSLLGASLADEKWSDLMGFNALNITSGLVITIVTMAVIVIVESYLLRSLLFELLSYRFSIYRLLLISALALIGVYVLPNIVTDGDYETSIWVLISHATVLSILLHSILVRNAKLEMALSDRDLL